MSYNRNQVDGDFAVRNNQTIGGDSTIRGNQTVEGDLYVNGKVIGTEVTSKDMGLFTTESALKTAVSTPTVGMYAFVGSTFPATLYLCSTAGTWTNTGKTVTFTAPTSIADQAMQAAAQTLVNKETTRAEFAEDTLTNSISKEVTDRKAGIEDIAKQLRRLSVFLNDHHHHDLDPDWLWRQLLLSAELDTDKDILTLMGVKYQLTRAEVSVAAPTISDPDDDGNITITTTETSGVIYYTTDGTDPTDASTKYSGAFAVDESCTIKAIVYVDGSKSSVTSKAVEVGKPYYIGWGVVYTDLNAATDFSSITKIKGVKSKEYSAASTENTLSGTASSRQCLFYAYPSTKTMSLEIKSASGATATPADSAIKTGSVKTIDGVEYNVKYIIANYGGEWISKINYTDNA